MPFSSTANVKEAEWTKTYDKFLKPALETFGFTCKKSEIGNRPITKYIVQDLKNSHMVIADLTDCNPNVMWELGVRHSLSQKTIMIASEKMKGSIPSDLLPYGIVFYKEDRTAYSDFVNEISNVLSKMENDPTNNSGPVFDSLKTDEFILSTYGRRQIINKLIGLMTEIGENLSFAKELIAGREPITEEAVTSTRYRLEALGKLFTENYVNGGVEYLKLLQSVRHTQEASNYRLNLITSTPDATYSAKIRTLLMNDAKNLQENLSRIMTITLKIYSDVKLNSLNEEEPNVIVTEELSKEFFK